jgi:hypothetical protein
MRGERALLLLIVGVFVASVAVSIAHGVPFENDESVYATQARAWAAGGPTTGIGLQRAPLFPAIGAVLYKAGARSEWPFRLTGLMFGAAAVVMTWALARAIAGPRAGLFAAGVFASAPNVQQRSAQFLTDVPAAAFLLALALVLWHNRARADRTLLLAAPIAAAAFYTRYASVLPIGLLVVVALAFWHRGLLRSPGLAAATIAIFAVLLVPHVVRAMDATGRPWGLVTYTARFAGRAYLGEGLVRYIAWWPYVLAGPIAAIFMTAGIVVAIGKRSPAAAFLVIPAVLDIVFIGVTEHADRRFIFFPVALLCIAGSIAITSLLNARVVAASVVGAALVAAGVFTYLQLPATRHSRIAPRLAGHVITARAHPPCTVHAVEIAETTWYSGCSTTYFDERPADFAVLYAFGGVRLRIQPAAPPAGARAIAILRDEGEAVASVFALPRPVQ